MNCEVPICNKEINQGNLICLDVKSFNTLTGERKNLNMFVSICNDCINKYNYKNKVLGEVKILLDR